MKNFILGLLTCYWLRWEFVPFMKQCWRRAVYLIMHDTSDDVAQIDVDDMNRYIESPSKWRASKKEIKNKIGY